MAAWQRVNSSASMAPTVEAAAAAGCRDQSDQRGCRDFMATTAKRRDKSRARRRLWWHYVVVCTLLLHHARISVPGPGLRQVAGRAGPWLGRVQTATAGAIWCSGKAMAPFAGISAI